MGEYLMKTNNIHRKKKHNKLTNTTIINDMTRVPTPLYALVRYVWMNLLQDLRIKRFNHVFAFVG